MLGCVVIRRRPRTNVSPFQEARKSRRKQGWSRGDELRLSGISPGLGNGIEYEVQGWNTVCCLVEWQPQGCPRQSHLCNPKDTDGSWSWTQSSPLGVCKARWRRAKGLVWSRRSDWTGAGGVQTDDKSFKTFWITSQGHHFISVHVSVTDRYWNFIFEY